MNDFSRETPASPATVGRCGNSHLSAFAAKKGARKPWDPVREKLLGFLLGTDPGSTRSASGISWEISEALFSSAVKRPAPSGLGVL